MIWLDDDVAVVDPELQSSIDRVVLDERSPGADPVLQKAAQDFYRERIGPGKYCTIDVDEWKTWALLSQELDARIQVLQHLINHLDDQHRADANNAVKAINALVKYLPKAGAGR